MAGLSRQDAEMLTEILDWIEHVLSVLVADVEATFLRSGPHQPPEFRAQMSAAWPLNQRRLTAIRSIVGQAIADNPDAEGAASVSRALVAQLEEHGLTGADLLPKHGSIRWIFKRFQRSRTLLWLRRFLKAANSILGSLGVAIPQAAAVGEFKDFLELALRE